MAPKILPQLEKLGILTVQDLLYHFPFRYEDWSKITPIGEIDDDGEFCVRARVTKIDARKVWKRNLMIIEAALEDDTGKCKATWFNQALIARVLAAGDEAVFCGKFAKKGRTLAVATPVYEKLTSKRSMDNLIHTARLVPQYHLTAGVTQKQLRALVWHVLENLEGVQETYPEGLLEEEKLLGLDLAIRKVHFPKSHAQLAKARERLAFDELYALHRRVITLKEDMRKSAAISVPFRKKETQDFVASLPFELTADQKKAAWAMLGDMEGAGVMSRLLNGDVGSGKTVVFSIGILNVALGGLQSALLVPTQVLAGQHFETLLGLFRGLDIGIALYTRTSQLWRAPGEEGAREATREEIRERIAKGEAHVIVGTHALLAQDIDFRGLALAVVDEQHRFGVKQRAWLRQHAGLPGITPHFLSLSATPIPRTLFLTFFADLDVSVIRTIPKNRKQVRTRIFAKKEREAAYALVQSEIDKGRQAFIVCPLVSESDVLGVKSVEKEYKRLQEEWPAFAKASAGRPTKEVVFRKLHGKLKPESKERVMREFRDGKFDILVSTSVVEVGIDVPNATAMLIEDPQRFGLAQLHQFRGRVGRGQDQAHCLLISDTEDLGKNERMRIFESTSDGFELSQKDLEMRGGGDVDGIRQSGLPQFKIARLGDFVLSSRAQKWARLFSTSEKL